MWRRFTSVIQPNGFFIGDFFPLLGRRMALGYDNTEVEVHIIAYIYHWGRNEILNLPIKDRKKYVEMIQRQREAENEDT